MKRKFLVILLILSLAITCFGCNTEDEKEDGSDVINDVDNQSEENVEPKIDKDNPLSGFDVYTDRFTLDGVDYFIKKSTFKDFTNNGMVLSDEFMGLCYNEETEESCFSSSSDSIYRIRGTGEGVDFLFPEHKMFGEYIHFEYDKYKGMVYDDTNGTMRIWEDVIPVDPFYMTLKVKFCNNGDEQIDWKDCKMAYFVVGNTDCPNEEILSRIDDYPEVSVNGVVLFKSTLDDVIKAFGDDYQVYERDTLSGYYNDISGTIYRFWEKNNQEINVYVIDNLVRQIEVETNGMGDINY